MIVKSVAAGVTAILGTQIFNGLNHLLIISNKLIPATATLELRMVNTISGKETKIFPKGKLNILPELAAQRMGYFTEKAYLIEICENANLSLNSGFLIVDLEGLDNTATHEISTVEDILGRVKPDPIIYERLTIPSGVKRQSCGVEDAQILALPNSSAIIEVSFFTKAGGTVRCRLAEIQALQRKENDLVFVDSTAAFGVNTMINGYKDWLTMYVDHCTRVEIETDGSTLEYYTIKNAK